MHNISSCIILILHKQFIMLSVQNVLFVVSKSIKTDCGIIVQINYSSKLLDDFASGFSMVILIFPIRLYAPKKCDSS